MEKTDGSMCRITTGRAQTCRDVLADLPAWFGIPAALDQYVRQAEQLEMFGCVVENSVVGFVSIKRHHAVTAEAYVLGVKRAWHRRGIGRALFAHVEDVLRRCDVRMMTVKTVGGPQPGPEYAATQAFYAAIGFVPVETFPTLWGPANPCLLMAKCLMH
jgi:ribosomal protein S18 acetylase RimI-like enzyme